MEPVVQFWGIVISAMILMLISFVATIAIQSRKKKEKIREVPSIEFLKKIENNTLPPASADYYDVTIKQC